MSRTIAGSTRATMPNVDSAAHAGCAVAVIAARHVSMPSPTSNISAAGASRTAPPDARPSIARSRRRHPPSKPRSSQVREMPISSPLRLSMRATIAGPKVPSGRRREGAQRSDGGAGRVMPRPAK